MTDPQPAVAADASEGGSAPDADLHPTAPTPAERISRALGVTPSAEPNARS